MKHIPATLLALAASAGFAAAQSLSYTIPVGYVTETLLPNQFNIVGPTMHNTVISSGIIDAEAPNTVTDNDVNFGAILTAGQTYVFELEDGTVQEVTSWSGSNLTTPQDISSLVTPGVTPYKLRQVATISSIFGPNNEAGLTFSVDGELDINPVDVIYAIDPLTNNFKFIYFFDDGDLSGWFDFDGNPADNFVLSYPEGIYVLRTAGSDIELVIEGEVKKHPTGGVLRNGFNYLSSVAPVGLTVGTSGLEAFLTSTDDSTDTADVVYVYDDTGAFTLVYRFDDGDTVGWFDFDGNPAEPLPLEGGFLILNRGGEKPYTLNVPSGYSTL